MSPDEKKESSSLKRPLGIVFIASLFAIGLYLLHHLLHFFFIVFAGILLGVFIDGLTLLLRKYSGLPRPAALAIVLVALCTLIFGMAWFTLPHVSQQIGKLADRIPSAFESLQTFIKEHKWGQSVLGESSSPQQALPLGSGIIERVSDLFSLTFGAIVDIVVIIFVGLYLAFDPKLYLSNIIRLFPKSRRDRCLHIMRAVGHALRWWILGRFLSMVVVGIFTYVGLLIIGMPMALTLALIAATLSFIPFIGPIISGIPAILVGLGESPIMALLALITYVIVQTLESYVITPFIQHKAVSIPPALLIFAQIMFGVIIGVIGTILATPLMVVLIVLVQLIYVEDILGDKAIPLGQH